MYEEQMIGKTCDRNVIGYIQKDVTLAQNIDNRILHLKDQVTRLERTKALLAEPGGLLNVPIDDLRFAMNY